MALVIDTFDDLVHIIETHPEWRRRLKRALFDIDIEAALTRLERTVEELVAFQRQQAVDLSQLKGDVSQLNKRVGRIESDVATLKGKSYEHDYRLKANAIFGRFVRRGRDLTDDIADLLHDAVVAGQVTQQEFTHVLAVDLLWGGKSRLTDDDLVVVLEASWRAETNDVERAKQRADTLRRIGLRAIPVVAGTEWDENALAAADALAVAVASDGLVNADSWRKALDR